MAELLFVSKGTGTGLSVYDLTGELVASPVTGLAAAGAVSAGPGWVALLYGGGFTNLLVLDPTDWSEIADIVVDAGASGSGSLLKSPDGSLLAVWGTTGLHFYNTSTWAEVVNDTTTTANITAFAWSTDGSQIAVGKQTHTRIVVRSGVDFGDVDYSSPDSSSYRANHIIFTSDDAYLIFQSSASQLAGSIRLSDGNLRLRSSTIGNTRHGLEYTAAGVVLISGPDSPYLKTLPTNYDVWDNSVPISNIAAAAPPSSSSWMARSLDGSILAVVASGSDSLRMYSGPGDTAITLSDAVDIATGAVFFDTAISSLYSIIPDATSVSEGDTVTFAVTAPSDDTLYYQISGDVDSSDIVGGDMSGPVTITSGVGEIEITLATDLVFDPGEAFIVSLFTDSELTVKVAISMPVTVSNAGSYVVLQLPMDGEVDSTTFPDVSINTKTVTANGDAKIVARSGYFAQVMDLGADGDFLSSSSSEYAVGTDDWYISGWFEIRELKAWTQGLVWLGTTGSNNNRFHLSITSGGALAFFAASTSTLLNVSGGSISPDTRYHFEFGRSGGRVYASLAGTVVVNEALSAEPNPAGNIYIGKVRSASVERSLDGYMDDLIFVRGEGPHTSNFTPPTEPNPLLGVKTYEITDDTTEGLVDEGDTVTYTITTTGVVDGSRLWWRLKNTGETESVTVAEVEYSTDTSIDSYDIEESETSFLADGPIEITGGVGTFELTLINDFSTEGLEYIVIDIYDEQGAPFGDGEPVATSDPVIVLDTSNSEGVDFSVVATVSGSPVTSVNEGQEIVFQVLVSEQPPAPHLIYYSIAGTVSAGDFSGGLSGEIEIDEFGVGSVTKTVTADTTTEGAETFAFRLHTGRSGGPQVATTPTITINDTSTSPPTYDISAPTSVNEGATVNATVTTTDVPDGTVLYWSTEGDVDAADFVDGQLTGSVTINSNSGTIPRAITADLLTEGDGFEDGDVASATSDTLTAEGVTWVADEHIGRLVIITNGTGEDQYRLVASNDGGTGNLALTVTVPWGVAPDDTSTYRLFTETFRLLLRSGSVSGTVLAETDQIRIIDTSVNPPEYGLSQSATVVAEGGSVTFTLTTAYVLDSTLYWTISGTATGADFSEGGSGTVDGSGGVITLTALRDYLVEGSESFVLRIHTGSTGGPIVISSDPVTVLDATYTVTPNVTQLFEGGTVIYTVLTTNHPSATFCWTVFGSAETTDFADSEMDGEVVISGGVGTITRTLASELSGPVFFYLQLRHTSIAGAVIATAPAVLARQIEPLDQDEWLNTDSDASRIFIIEMQHSEGWVDFGNYPYVSKPGDTTPNRPYDDSILDVADIESRIDGALTVGETSIAHGGEYDYLLVYKWRGYEMLAFLGEPGWSRDDFRPFYRAINGGLSRVEPGEIAWETLDSKAVMAVPLLETFLTDGRPVPLAIGKPFNITPILLDDPTHEYQAHDGAVVSMAVRESGAVVAATVDTGAGTFTLGARPQGSIGVDPVTPITTVAQIFAWACSREGVDLDGDTTAALPAYELGLFYDSQTELGIMLDQVVGSIGGYWDRTLLGEVAVYQLDEPSAVPDFVLRDGDIIEVRYLGEDPPIKTLTMNYRPNYSPVARESLLGSVIDDFPALTEDLINRSRTVSYTNTLVGHPGAPDLTIDTNLIDDTDALSEVTRRALLRSVTRQRWEFECFLTAAKARLGLTGRFFKDSQGWSGGRDAVVVAIKPDPVGNRITLEVWL